jgi:Uma2 family endonuclease
MPTVLEEILLSPQLPSHFETIRQTLEAERARRERFYEEVTEERKVEFINGEIIVHSPAKDRHSVAVLGLSTLLGAYVRKHRLGKVRGEKALVVMSRNDYEPDVMFFGLEKARTFLPDQMKYPAPDFVVEVLSPSTLRNDRTVKFVDYAANGVGEYWIVDPVLKLIEKYVLRADRYDTAETFSSEQEISSSRIEGFTIPVAAVFDEDRAFAVLRELVRD